jgi:hypothetical protein
MKWPWALFQAVKLTLYLGSGYYLADFYARKKSACSSCTLQYGAIMMNTQIMGGRNFHQLRTHRFCHPTACQNQATLILRYNPSFPSTTSESPNGTSSAGPTPTPTCTGKTYVSTQGDTCQSISKSQSISTDRLVEINNLDYACKSLVPGTNLCIDKTCETYTVKTNETCQSIVKGTDVWNGATYWLEPVSDLIQLAQVY